MSLQIFEVDGLELGMKIVGAKNLIQDLTRFGQSSDVLACVSIAALSAATCLICLLWLIATNVATYYNRPYA